MGDFLSQEEIDKLMGKFNKDSEKEENEKPEEAEAIETQASSKENKDVEQKSAEKYEPKTEGQKAEKEESTDAEEVLIEKAKFKPLSIQETKKEKRDIREYNDVSLGLSVILGNTTLTVRDVLALQKGSVIELDKLAGDNVDIFINDSCLAKGEVVAVNENFGFRITNI